MQLHSHAVPLFAMTDNSMRNEFVMRMQPGEAIYAKVWLLLPCWATTGLCFVVAAFPALSLCLALSGGGAQNGC